ncbi:MAG: hypothetical protein ABI990_00065 [Actinomycetota bacterium]
MNAGIGVEIASGKRSLALLVAGMPLLLAVFGWLAFARRHWLAFAPFVLALLVGPLAHRLPGTGGTALYPSDIVLALAFGGWLVSHLVQPADTPRWPRTFVLSWPFVLVALTILLGVLRGHARYGTNYLSEPTRFFLYAGVAGAIAGMTAKEAYRGLVVVFYAGTAVQTILGLYHLASGTSQTASAALSTGGPRALALSTAMYLAGALILALLNVELDRGGRRQALHLVVAGLAAFDVIISLGRTTFAALAVLIPVMILALRHTRRAVVGFVPLLLPVLVLLVLVVVQVRPSLPSTLSHRLTGHVSNDTAVITRQREYDAMIAGVGKELALGVGFGRTVRWISDDGSVQQSSGDLENSYLWILAGGGLLALSSVILLILAFFGDAIRRLRGAEPEARALLIFSMSLVFIFAVNALTGPLFSDPTFALGVWVALLLPATVRRTPPPEAEEAHSVG